MYMVDNCLNIQQCDCVSTNFSERAPMASLNFNPSRIRHPPLHSHKSNPNFTSLPKSIKYPFHVCPFSTKSPSNLSKILQFLPNSVSESSVSLPLEAAEEDDPTAEMRYLDPETDPESISEWELDFCSRPILDIRGKKIWELVVCDDSLSLQYTKYFPNNVINSITLKDAMVSICDEFGVPLPDKIRYFR